MGGRVCSAGAGAGVRRRERIREKREEWPFTENGAVNGGGVDVEERGRGRPDADADDPEGVGEVAVLLSLPFVDAGYSSNSSWKISIISCLVPTSPGFLSLYRRTTSCAHGVGHDVRRAKHPMDDVDRALMQRKSSWRILSSRCSSLQKRERGMG